MPKTNNSLLLLIYGKTMKVNTKATFNKYINRYV